MLETLGWFAVVYACVSITVTILMLIFANKAFKLGGPLGMIRTVVILVVAGIGVLCYVCKELFGGGTQGSVRDGVKSTIRKTSSWLDDMKSEWEGGPKE